MFMSKSTSNLFYDVVKLHLNFPFVKKGHPAFSFSSSYFPLYWANSGYKESWCFHLFRRPFFYAVGGILHSHLSGPDCFPVLDGYT